VRERAGRTVGRPQPQPRRWPWLLLLAAAAGGAAFALLRRRRSDDDLWVSPAGDGPVPSYREDPVPHSSSDSAKTPSTSGSLSAAQTSPGDAPPPDTDLGMQPQQMSNPPVTEGDVPEPDTSSSSDPAMTTPLNAPSSGPTEGPAAANERPTSVDPVTDATNDEGGSLGEAGTPLANRGQEPEADR
jgi:hypothetical protein